VLVLLLQAGAAQPRCVLPGCGLPPAGRRLLRVAAGLPLPRILESARRPCARAGAATRS